MKITKNEIMGIVAAVGFVLSFVFGLVGGLEPSIVFIILTVAAVAGVFFFYENPGGETCTPKKKDPNAVTYVTDKIGKCVPSTCNPDYYVISEKCQKPTSLPTGDWKVTSSNGYSSNIISTFNNITTTNSCAYMCLNTKGCNTASFASNVCTLYTQSGADNNVKGDLITRPAKEKST
jgi:hypothetical protein